MDIDVSIITVVYDRGQQTVRLDIGDLDPWSAHSLLERAAERVYDDLEPVLFSDEEEIDEDDEDDDRRK